LKALKIIGLVVLVLWMVYITVAVEEAGHYARLACSFVAETLPSPHICQ